MGRARAWAGAGALRGARTTDSALSPPSRSWTIVPNKVLSLSLSLSLSLAGGPGRDIV